ncbi:MAG: hypothetical protein ACLFPS_09130 [Clostridia bacterium]
MIIAEEGDKIVCPRCVEELYKFTGEIKEDSTVDLLFVEAIPPQPPAKPNKNIICEHCGYHFVDYDFTLYSRIIRNEE